MHLFAEGEGLTEAEVGSELAVADSIIGRDDRLSGHGHGVKVAPAGADHIGGIGKTRGKGRAGIEGGEVLAAAQVIAQSDVNGRSGIRHDKGKELKPPRQIPTATQEEAVAHIVGGAPIILFQIVLVHGEAAAAGGVAVNVTEGIKAEERNLGAANIEISDQLVLVVKAGGLVLIQVGEAGVGPGVAGIRRVRRIDVPRDELMDAVGVEIGHGDRGDFGNLPLQPYS